MGKPLFSVCLIGRNEEHTLPRLIKSLSEFQNRWWEIILVDTWSKDDTVKVAIDLWVNVIEAWNRFLMTIDSDTADHINKRFVVDGEKDVISEWDTLFDFASARNYAASLANNHIVAMPDCDEIYTCLDIDSINDMIRWQNVDQFEYEFVFSHNEDGSPSLQFRHSKFYNKKKLAWDWVVHEVLKMKFWEIVNKRYVPEDVIKLEHYQNEKTNRAKYLTWLAYDCFFNPENDRNSHYFWREMMYHHRYRSAIKEFKRHIAMDKWHTEKAQSMTYIGDCLMNLWEEQEAIWRYTRSLDTEPLRREPLLALARHYHRKSNHRLCLVYALWALQLPWSSYYSNYVPNYREIPHELLYWAYWYLWDRSEAKKHYNIAVWYNPEKQKYLHDRKFFYPWE